MSLNGKMNEFPLLDIFRLISWSKRTGHLTVAAGEKEGKISFFTGKVCFALTPQNRVPIGLRLVNAGLISKQELEEALRLQQNNDSEKRVGEILVSRGLIKQEKLEGFIQEQIQDALFEILDWEDGYYAFDLVPDLGQENFGIDFTVKNVIEETEKRRQEWAKIREMIPSTQMVVHISELPSQGQEEILIKPEEWRILYLLNEERSISELKEKGRLNLLRLCQTLMDMATKSLVQIAPPSNNETQTQAPAEEKEVEEVAESAADENTPRGGGKYVKDFQKDSAQEINTKISVPLEWTRYLTAPKRHTG